MPVLPPTEESTCASSEVGTCHEIDAAAQDRRREAGEIADHAAAERDDEIVALDLRRDQRLADFFETGVAFRPLAFLDDDGARSGCRQRPASFRLASSQCFANGAIGTMAVRTPGRNAATRAPNDGSTSRPMTMS